MRSSHVVAGFLVAACALLALAMTKFRPNYQPSVHPQVRLRSGRLAAVPIPDTPIFGSTTPPPPPPPPPAAAGAVPGLPLAPASLTLAFGTASMESYVSNWLAFARRVPELKPYAVVALDEALEKTCAGWGEPVVSASALLEPLGGEVARLLKSVKSGNGWLRNDAGRFKTMGYLKAMFTWRLLELGYDVLLSDADSVWLASPWPYLGRPGVAHAADAGSLPLADVLATNDLPDPRRDGQPDSVYNSGALFFRATARARRFVGEWANRTLHTGVIGNDQTELNRLLRSRYGDGKWECNRPECLEPDLRRFVPLVATFAGSKGHDCPVIREEACPVRCGWRVSPSAADGYSGLMALAAGDHDRWRACEAHNLRMGRKAVAAHRWAYWMWGGRVAFGLLPMERFLQGHTFFLARLHEARGVAPIHVHMTYTMGGDYGKRWRMRAGSLWEERDTSYYTRGAFVAVDGVEALVEKLLERIAFPPDVWGCERGDIAGIADRPSRFFRKPDGSHSRPCYHPKHFVAPSRAAAPDDPERWPDPAAPHVMVQYVTRMVIRNALALAAALGRRLVLPRSWSFCDRHWWQLRDCRVPGAETLALPIEAPLDVAFNAEAWANIQGVEFVEPSFLDHPLAKPLLANVATLRVAAPPAGAAAGAAEVMLPNGIAVDLAADHIAEQLTRRAGKGNGGVAAGNGGVATAQLLRVDATSLLRLSRCGFAAMAAASKFQSRVVAHAFVGQYSYCSEERNPDVEALLREAHARGVTEESLLLTRRNCTGQPANAFNKPKVDLGPASLAFAPPAECAANGGATEDGAERTLAAALALYPALRRTLK